MKTKRMICPICGEKNECEIINNELTDGKLIRTMTCSKCGNAFKIAYRSGFFNRIKLSFKYKEIKSNRTKRDGYLKDRELILTSSPRNENRKDYAINHLKDVLNKYGKQYEDSIKYFLGNVTVILQNDGVISYVEKIQDESTNYSTFYKPDKGVIAPICQIQNVALRIIRAATLEPILRQRDIENLKVM